MPRRKPVVFYRANLPSYIEQGRRAVVTPVNHPDTRRVSNSVEVITSMVVSICPLTGEFETENTLYRPLKETENA